MKNTINRRDFLKFLGFSTASFVLTPSLLKAATNPSIVVVGGGFAGATCAKYLKFWGGSSVDVTVIEENANYVSPILSNLVLNNQKVIGDITFGYQNHANTYQVNMVHKKLSTIDKDNKILTLNDSTTLSYDYLVLAPGIDFSPVSGHDFTKVPHAWIAGTQTVLLKQQIDSMVDGYSNCKVTVLDANADIIVEKDTFGSVFTSYGVDYIPNGTVRAVDSDAKIVTYDTLLNSGITKSAKVLNIIPNQKAASLIFDAGLNSGNWASADAISYESTISSGIYIIGDSQGTSQPKAGHIGNAEAKVCADAILRKINGVALYANPKTNSACYSPISTTKASWLTVVYEYDSSTKNMVPVSGAGYPTVGSASTTNYNKMFGWSTNLFKDTFY